MDNMRKLFILAGFFIVLCSCSKELYQDSDLIIDSTNGVEYHLFDWYTDDYGNSGVVIDVYKDKRIFVVSADEEMLTWGNQNDWFDKMPEIFGSTTGLNFSQVATERGLDFFPAIKWCLQLNNLKHGDVPQLGDWLLMSTMESHFLFQQKEEVNSVLEEHGYSPISGSYWCANNYSQTDAYFANDIAGVDHMSKEKVLGVRAVKYIYYK